ncbi:MAG TPA: type IV pilus modification protein PilV [Steroidobacteraceae bacterium]|nr:type IV pilus modification protein PilV [Steroidobacteraceae bacterium]
MSVKHLNRTMRSRQRGISMIEAMVALVVISVGMLGVAGLYLSSLQAGRAANLRTQAVNLATEMADRIRANRLAKTAYANASGNLPSYVDCQTVFTCTPEQLAQMDVNLWVNAIRSTLPGGNINATGTIVVTDLTASEGVKLTRYQVTVGWREAGSDINYSYPLVLEL